MIRLFRFVDSINGSKQVRQPGLNPSQTITTKKFHSEIFQRGEKQKFQVKTLIASNTDYLWFDEIKTDGKDQLIQPIPFKAMTKGNHIMLPTCFEFDITISNKSSKVIPFTIEGFGNV